MIDVDITSLSDFDLDEQAAAVRRDARIHQKQFADVLQQMALSKMTLSEYQEALRTAAADGQNILTLDRIFTEEMIRRQMSQEFCHVCDGPVRDRFKHIRVFPYVGSEYENNRLFNVKVMILGESNYYDGGQLCQQFNRHVVEKWSLNATFFTKVTGVFKGRTPTLDEKKDFWKSVLFYNYIQETVGEGPRMRPKSEMWPDSAPAFWEVLAEYKPDLVLVLGTELWYNLPIPTKEGPELDVGEKRKTKLYDAGGKMALAVGIKHPSSGGWSYEEWSPVVAAGLKAAESLRM